jgi:hypothetical protein
VRVVLVQNDADAVLAPQPWLTAETVVIALPGDGSIDPSTLPQLRESGWGRAS